MRGHTNNVSCVLFHPKHELIVSNSEDRTIRVWDISKRMSVQTFRRETDRFWILAAHSDQNLLAAGHDSGMIVFKLERERPPFDVHGNTMFYVKDRYLRLLEFATSRDVPIHSLRRTTGGNTPGLGGGPKQLQYNSFNSGEHDLLVTSETEGGSYELITFACESGPGSSPSGEPTEARRGSCLAVAFLARNRFAVLDRNRQLVVKNMKNEVVRKINPPLQAVDNIFFGGTAGRLLVRSEDKIVLFDQQARKVLNEIQVSRVKYVVWSHDCSFVALLGKHQVSMERSGMKIPR
jgi:coatomer protein complex subunit alpha (xenin)